MPPPLPALLPPCPQQFTPAASYLWMALAGLLLAGLLVLFAFELLRRRQEDLLEGYRRLDRWLARHLERPWRLIKRRFSTKQWQGFALTASTLVVLVTIYVFAAITEGWANEEALYQLDRTVHGLFQRTLTPPVVRALRLVTHLGDLAVAAAISAVVGALLVYRREGWRLLALFLTMGVGEALVWTLKLIFSRSRPDAGLTDTVGQSFPSAHAFTAVALYGFLIYLTWRWTNRDSLRLTVTALLTLLTLVICISRILLSVHWTSDVLGGFTIGLGWLLFSLFAARGYRTYKAQHA